MNEPGSRFCTACGSGLPEAAPPEPAPPEPASPEPASPEPASPEPAPPEPAQAHDVAATVRVDSPTEELPAVPPPPPAPPPAPTPAATPLDVRPVSMVGALAAAVGVFLPWVEGLFADLNGLDAPVEFLWDFQTTADATLSLGVLILAAAGGAVLLALIRGANEKLHLLRPLGLVILAIGVVFLVQVFRGAEDAGVSFGDVYGIGPFVSALGGLLIVSGK